MRISRLYTAIPLTVGKTLELDEEYGHYVRTVLRLKKDAEIILFNGTGGEYLGTLVEVSRKTVLISL
ncbi:MAG: 16S rRNA (uracil(1498)-N(3))-methyltransferase, partial [Methylococcales bacterium]